METEHGKNGTAQEREGRHNNFRDSESFSGVLGTTQATSAGNGTYQVGASREDSQGTNTFILGGGSSEGIAGKLIGQLINETEKQLAYYDQQSQLLKSRLQELKEISEAVE